MNVGFLQLDVAWLDISANLNKIKTILQANCQSIDLLVLPEMFNTGFIMEPQLYSQIYSANTIHTLIKLANQHELVITGSIPMSKTEGFYNTMVFVDKNGIIDTYDKVHLFTPAGEKRNYNSGHKSKDIPLNIGAKIRPIICYDLRFPYASYNATGYDILVCSANWPVSRIDQWRHLLIARAIENQCYVIACNRIGQDANGYDYDGHSMVIDYTGQVILEQNNTEGVFSTSISLNDMINYRSKLPFLKDQKSFSM